MGGWMRSRRSDKILGNIIELYYGKVDSISIDRAIRKKSDRPFLQKERSHSHTQKPSLLENHSHSWSLNPKSLSRSKDVL